MPKHSGNTQVERLTVRTKSYTITDAVLTSGLTITAPFPGHIKLVASGITVSKRLNVNLTGGEFEDGEELTITVQQSDTYTEGKILRVFLNPAGTSTAPGFFYGTGHDQGTPVPHDGATTVFKFIYNKSKHYFIQTQLGSVYTQPQLFNWDWGNTAPLGSQSTVTAMSGMWYASKLSSSELASASPLQVSNPVYFQNTTVGSSFAQGLAVWATISGGTLSLIYTWDGINIRVSSGYGAVSGTILKLRARKSPVSNKVQMWLTTTTNLYEVSAQITSASLPGTLSPDGSLVNVSALTTTLNGNAAVYKDSVVDKLYFADSTNVKDRVFGGSTTTVANLGVAITAMARSTDGAIAAVGGTGGSCSLLLSTNVLGTSATFGSVLTPTLTGASNIVGLAWDRQNARWLILDDSGQIFASTSIAGTTFNLLIATSIAPTAQGSFQAVGDVIVYSNLVITLISTDGGAHWVPLMSAASSGNVVTISGVTYLKGRLIMTPYFKDGESSLLTSMERCFKMGSLDFDK